VRRLAAVLTLVLLAGVALAQDRWPPGAERRFQEALRLKLERKHREAAEAYRSVADWPEGGDWKERAQALYFAAAELHAAGELERALDTYREVERRFPKSDFAAVAHRDAERLQPAGVAGGLDFQRRHEAAWDVLSAALTLDVRGEREAARPGLEKALDLLQALLRDHRDHPGAVDVTIAMSDVLVRLDRLDEALAVAEEAVTLAERETKKPDAADAARGELLSARRQLGEARSALRGRALDRAGMSFLVALAVALACARPWRRLARRLVTLWLVLVAVDGALAVLAIVGFRYLRAGDPDSIITDSVVAALVVVPGATGITASVLATASLGARRWSGVLSATAGVLAALATSTCLVQHYRLFAALLP
jgi:tetratricopeptide (TPR) repeat protein